MTESEKNPHGKVPVISGFEETTENIGNWISDTPPAKAISGVGRFLHEEVVSPVMDTAVGRTFLNLAAIPLGIAEGTAGVVRAGYKELDETLFRGWLPGGTSREDFKAGERTDFTDEAALALKKGVGEPIEALFGEDVVSKADATLGVTSQTTAKDHASGRTTFELINDMTREESVEALKRLMEMVEENRGIDPETPEPSFTVNDWAGFPDGTVFPVDTNSDISIPEEMKLPDIVNGELVPHEPEPEIPAVAEEMWDKRPYTPEWFAGGEMVVAPDLKVETYHMKGADGKLTPIHDMPVFWDWLDAKRNDLGSAKFEAWVLDVHGAKHILNTPYGRYLDRRKPSKYLRKYGVKYPSHVAMYRPQVKAFYDEMVVEGNLALEGPENVDSDYLAGRGAEISADVLRNQNLQNAIGAMKPATKLPPTRRTGPFEITMGPLEPVEWSGTVNDWAGFPDGTVFP